MFAKENMDKNVPDDDEKCVNGNNCRNGIELIILEPALVNVEIKIVNIEMVMVNSIKNVCNFNRTSK